MSKLTSVTFFGNSSTKENSYTFYNNIILLIKITTFIAGIH